MIIEGKTKSGINFAINDEIKDDTRLLQYLTDMDDKVNPLKASKAFFNALKLMFGGEDGLAAFQDTIALQHDGICNAKYMMQELTDILEALNLKN